MIRLGVKAPAIDIQKQAQKIWAQKLSFLETFKKGQLTGRGIPHIS
jgi:hypothetical protein